MTQQNSRGSWVLRLAPSRMKPSTAPITHDLQPTDIFTASAAAGFLCTINTERKTKMYLPSMLSCLHQISSSSWYTLRLGLIALVKLYPSKLSFIASNEFTGPQSAHTLVTNLGRDVIRLNRPFLKERSSVVVNTLRICTDPRSRDGVPTPVNGLTQTPGCSV